MKDINAKINYRVHLAKMFKIYRLDTKDLFAASQDEYYDVKIMVYFSKYNRDLREQERLQS